MGRQVVDANGNTLNDAQGRSFTWDIENHLTQVVNPGVGTTTFRYDPWGRRVQKSGPLGTTNYLYDGENLIGEVDNSGNVLARYAQSANIDEPLSEFRGNTASYYQEDVLGSVTSLSDAAGGLAKTYSYASFGTLTASTGTISNPFQYTAREFDQETGLYEYRARYYDPQVGRFVSEDPIRVLGGLDFYRYALNSPVSFLDPMGLSPCRKEIPIYCNKDVIDAMKKIWAQSSNGGSGAEAAFVLNGSEDQYQIVNQGFTNQRNHMTMRIQSDTFAIFHVHPNNSNWKPSTPGNNSENNGKGDTGVADEQGVDMYVVSKDGLGFYDPSTKEITKVRNGLDWTKPCPD